MDKLHIGTCVRHTPQTKRQAFIGSGTVFALDNASSRCSLVLVQGIVIPGMAMAALLDGSWLISARTMTAQQIHHLLGNARRVFEWCEGAHPDLPINARSSTLMADLLNQTLRLANGPGSQPPFSCDAPAAPYRFADRTY